MRCGLTPHDFDEIGYPLGDNAGFAAAGAGQNEHGTFDCLNGFLLFRVEACKYIHK